MIFDKESLGDILDAISIMVTSEDVPTDISQAFLSMYIGALKIKVWKLQTETEGETKHG